MHAWKIKLKNKIFFFRNQGPKDFGEDFTEDITEASTDIPSSVLTLNESPAKSKGAQQNKVNLTAIIHQVMTSVLLF